MTTSEGARSGTERRAAEANTAPGTELSRTGTRAAAQQTTPLTGVATPPDDLRQLEAEIERTREELGATVQELAARADVKTRARAKAAEVTGRVRSTTMQARTNAAARAGSLRSQVASTPMWEATPEQVRSAAAKGAHGARERWVPLTVAAGVLVVGYVAVGLWRRRYSNAPSLSAAATPSHHHARGRARPGRTRRR